MGEEAEEEPTFSSSQLLFPTFLLWSLTLPYTLNSSMERSEGKVFEKFQGRDEYTQMHDINITNSQRKK